ncbi:MAG: hypothetical protein ACRCZQ_01550 [Bacteroidales bacterium]
MSGICQRFQDYGKKYIFYSWKYAFERHEIYILIERNTHFPAEKYVFRGRDTRKLMISNPPIFIRMNPKVHLNGRASPYV